MSDIEKYSDQPAGRQEMVQFEQVETPQPVHQGEAMDVAGAMLRRWPLIIGVAVLVCGIGFAAMLKFVKKEYRSEGAVEIASIVPAILYSDTASEGPMPNYENFKNGQAKIMGSDKVLNRVADEMSGKGLKFFAGRDDYLMALREAVDRGVIKIEPDRNSNLITIQMFSTMETYKQAEQIIDSIIRSYMAVSGVEQTSVAEANRVALEDRRKQLQSQIERQKETIRNLVDEFGTGELTGRQDLMFEQMASLQRELINVDIRRMALESQIKARQPQEQQGDSTPTASEMVERRNVIIRSDPALQGLAADIRRYEELVMTGKQNMVSTNPELARREEMLASLQERYKQRSREAAEEIDKTFQAEQERSRQSKVSGLQAQLEQVKEYKKLLDERVKTQDSETIVLGRKQWTINDQTEQLEQTKALLAEVTRRIQELDIESKRPDRISVAFNASSVQTLSKRRKMAAGVAFGGLAAGIGLALLLEKRDKSLREPQDIVRRVGIRIIGTTTSSRDVNKKFLGQQLLDDYQTIRANLGLLGIDQEAKIIAVSSAGAGDGKTTFSINLATSFARAGQKTLLIDGDLRKPDVAITLGLGRNQRGLQEYLFGQPIEKCLYRVESPGFYILAADERNCSDAVDLIGQKTTEEKIRILSGRFDKIIIDTPPVLGFADALLWSKMADGVVLVSFVGHTSRPDLKESLDRLKEAGAHILGTVVNNVRVQQSYRRYGYGYGYGYGGSGQDAEKRARHRRKSPNMLIFGQDQDDSQKS